MGAGTSRMNDVTVIQAAQGLCAYLGQQFGDDAPSRGVVVGYDHRGTDSLSSRTFAMYTAAAFLSRGFTVYLYPDLVATPLVVRCPPCRAVPCLVVCCARHVHD